MISSNSNQKIMAKTLSYKATGDTKKVEQHLQVVAINNFLWRTDQLIWRREDVAATKMLQKAVGVSTRMVETPEEIAKELRIRKKLLEERVTILPQLTFNIHSNTEVRFECFDSQTHNNRQRFLELLEFVVFVRKEIFVNEIGISENVELDGRDESSRHIVAWVGDSIVGGGRWWIQPSNFAPIPVAIVDRLFVLKEHRSRGLGKALFEYIKNDAKALRYPVFPVVRTDIVINGQTAKPFETTKQKLLNSKGFRLVGPDTWIPHLGISGAMGAGVQAAVFEPAFAGI